VSTVVDVACHQRLRPSSVTVAPLCNAPATRRVSSEPTDDSCCQLILVEVIVRDLHYGKSMDVRTDVAAIAPPRERTRTARNRLLLILPVLGASIYPALLIGMYTSGRWASAHPSPISYLVVAVGLTVVFAVPFYGFVAAYRIGRLAAPTAGEHFMRVLFHLVAAAPPYSVHSAWLRSCSKVLTVTMSLGSLYGLRSPSMRMTEPGIVGLSHNESWRGCAARLPRN
jgi:hypothetical protein